MARVFSFRCLLWSSVLSSALLVGCGTASAPPTEGDAPSANLPSPEMMDNRGGIAAEQQPQAKSAEATQSTSGVSDVTLPGAMPQLIKQADLVLVLNQVDQGLEAAIAIAHKWQGDVISLQDWQPQSGEHRQVNLVLRVPQAKLDSALADLRALGTLKRQSLSAEDVSDQLVDLQARLRNLRKTEASLLEIMERSGSIAEVLQVSHELSTVRETIERTDAQAQFLKRQVAYSTITLTLEGAIATTPTTTPLGETLANTWQSATHSVATLSVSLLKLSLWLLAYSPYWLILGLMGFGLYRLRQRHLTHQTNSASHAEHPVQSSQG